MKKVTGLARRLGMSFCAVLLVGGSLTLTGCSFDSLGGPDLGSQVRKSASNGSGSVTKGDGHNEDGSNKNGSGSVTKGDGHNEDGSN